MSISSNPSSPRLSPRPQISSTSAIDFNDTSYDSDSYRRLLENSSELAGTSPRICVPVFIPTTEYTPPTSPINNEKKRKADTEELQRDTKKLAYDVARMPESANVIMVFGTALPTSPIISRRKQVLPVLATAARISDNVHEQSNETSKPTYRGYQKLEEKLLGFKEGDKHRKILDGIRYFFFYRKT